FKAWTTNFLYAKAMCGRSFTPGGFGWHTADDVRQMREHTRMATARQLQQLLPADVEPEAPLETECIV
ncbi:hypothetical protein C1X77_25865, partial [Pseudomonas sp. GW531-E2]